jgi:ribosome-associated heat shock protein Hsp15
VRVDKWLQVARAFKTRTQATHACDLGRVRVNGTAVKPHRALAVGDKVEVEIGDWTRVLVVRELADKPLAKADAPRLFEDLSLPRPARDSIAHLLRRPPVERAAGAGRPTKRDRREMERFAEGAGAGSAGRDDED